MADVEMTDAGAAPKVKTSKAAVPEGEGKKRFEVKKVGCTEQSTMAYS